MMKYHEIQSVKSISDTNIGRAAMRKMVKRLLKKYKYPPEYYDMALDTVINQCELWTDNVDMPDSNVGGTVYEYNFRQEDLPMVAEEAFKYNN